MRPGFTFTKVCTAAVGGCGGASTWPTAGKAAIVQPASSEIPAKSVVLALVIDWPSRS